MYCIQTSRALAEGPATRIKGGTMTSHECSGTRVVLALSCLVASAGATASVAGETECVQLTTRAVSWPDPGTRIENASWRAAGFAMKSPMGSVTLPAHCEVTAVMHERAGVDGQHYAIRFRM